MKPMTARQKNLVSWFKYSVYLITVPNRLIFHSRTERYDDRIDDAMAFPALAQAAILEENGCIDSKETIQIQVAIRDSRKGAQFKFSCMVRTSPRIETLNG